MPTMPRIKLQMDSRGAQYLMHELGGPSTFLALRQITAAYGKKIVDGTIEDMRKSDVPSSPGESPGIRTGTLSRRMTVETRHTGSSAEARVGPTVDYGKYLFEGTSRMAARPYMVGPLNRVLSGYKASILATMSQAR